VIKARAVLFLDITPQSSQCHIFLECFSLVNRKHSLVDSKCGQIDSKCGRVDSKHG
jgi:hypothetical protein